MIIVVKRPPVRPKDKAAYDQARAKQLRNRIILILVVVSILIAVFWKFTIAVILIAFTSIFTASSPWILPLFAYMYYNDSRHK